MQIDDKSPYQPPQRLDLNPSDAPTHVDERTLVDFLGDYRQRRNRWNRNCYLLSASMFVIATAIWGARFFWIQEIRDFPIVNQLSLFLGGAILFLGGIVMVFGPIARFWLHRK